MKSFDIDSNKTTMIKLQLFNALLTVLLCLLIGSSAHSQSGPCNICSQEDVDNYVPSVFFPVRISGDDITNLDGLSGLVDIPLGVLEIWDCPLLENTDGLSALFRVGKGTLILDNPLLERINMPLLQYSNVNEFFHDGIEIRNNGSLDSISMGSLDGTNVILENNESLKSFESNNGDGISLTITGSLDLSEIILANTLDTVYISGSNELQNLDGFGEVTNVNKMTFTDNPSLNLYCGLNNVVMNDLNTEINLSGNLKNPSNEEILLEGSCGNFVRAFIGYETLAEALDGASDHSFIFVPRDFTFDTPLTFSGMEKHTLVIQPNVTMTFSAPFTNQGIVINHGTLEMLTGAVFTNSGAFVNTGMLIAN